MKWPKCHQNLVAVVFLLAVACLLAWMFRLRPQWQEYDRLRAEREGLEGQLKSSAWPRDASRLDALLRDYRKRIDKDLGTGTGQGLREYSENVLRRATSQFHERIIGEYGSLQDFMQKASQTEYKDQYDRLDTYLLGHKVNLDQSIYGMDESTNEPHKYQMLLKLWTTQGVVDCAVGAGLRVTQSRSSRGRPASQVHICPMRAYALSDSSAEAYLLEFPVQMEVRGKLEAFRRFVQSLCSENHFYPIIQMELVTTPPRTGGKNPDKGDKDGFFRTHDLTARVVCSSFFMPKAGEAVKMEVKKTLPPLPGGM
ncbi:MAG: hypothetical protein IJJ33_19380 [Victivallales bacterium]|nr:hypothetical protein [Victivallales bacterium]